MINSEWYDLDAGVLHTISENIRVPLDRLHQYTNLRDDLHLDTTDIFLLIATLENRFGYYLSPEEVAAIETVGDANTFFRKQLV